MKILRRILFFVLFLFLFLCMGIILWCFVPAEKMDVSKTFSMHNMAYLKFNLNKGNVSLWDEAVDFKFAEEFLAGSFMNRLALKAGGRFFSPFCVMSLVNKSPGGEDDFNYVFLIKSQKIARFLQISFGFYSKSSSFKEGYELEKFCRWSVWKSRKTDEDLKAVAFCGDTCIFFVGETNVAEFMSDMCSDSKAKPEKTKLFNKTVLWPFFLYLEDDEKVLNFYLSKAKEKTSYDFFPAISDLKEAFVSFGKESVPGKREGNMNFYFEETTDFKKAGKDIWFLSQVLKRMFEANFYDYKYELDVVKNEITVNFELTNRRKSK
ncbi:MAG: hypothetical protein ABH836_08400 [Candidatus Omnitrophota bacterium]